MGEECGIFTFNYAKIEKILLIQFVLMLNFDRNMTFWLKMTMF